MEGKISAERIDEIVEIMNGVAAESRIGVTEGKPSINVWAFIERFPEYGDDLSVVADMASPRGAFALTDGTVLAYTGFGWYVATDRHLR